MGTGPVKLGADMHLLKSYDRTTSHQIRITSRPKNKVWLPQASQFQCPFFVNAFWVKVWPWQFIYTDRMPAAYKERHESRPKWRQANRVDNWHEDFIHRFMLVYHLYVWYIFYHRIVNILKILKSGDWFSSEMASLRFLIYVGKEMGLKPQIMRTLDYSFLALPD